MYTKHLKLIRFRCSPLQEFIKALAIHDLEPAFNPIMEARERGLKIMKDRLKKPFKFQKEYESMYATAMQRKAESEALDKAAAESRSSLNQSYKSGPKDNPRANLVQVDWLKSTKPVPRLPAPGSDKNPGYDGRPVESGEELFGDLARIGDAIVRSCQSDKSGRDHHSHDNSRIGFGTGGIDPSSGSFADSRARFTTTYSQYYAPLVYQPNVPVSRPTGLCNSTVEAGRRALRRNARLARSQVTKDAIAEAAKQAELMELMDQDQREREAAAAAYAYNRKAYFKDLRLQSRLPLEVMSKRPHWPRHASTYCTSQKTQLRDMVKHSDTRDMQTVFKKDFSFLDPKPHPPANAANRAAREQNLASSFRLTHDDGAQTAGNHGNMKARMTQTSAELRGGVVPDLHRTSMKNRW
jgi:hypothetical protein